MADADEWVRLTSGEWLKGEFKRMQNEQLVLDSDKLDDQSLDWDEVEEFWTSAPMTCLFDDLVSRTGPLHVIHDEVRIGSDPPQVMPRDQLLTIVREGSTELERWSGRASFGLTSLSGNTDQQDLSWAFSTRRDRSRTAYKLDYQGQVTSVDGSQTANNHFLRTSYLSILGARTYVVPILIDAWRDRFKNVAYQLTPAGLYGYKLVDEIDREWSVAGGAGLQHTRYRSVEAGEDDSDSIPVAILMTEYERDLTADWDLSISASHQAQIGAAHENSSRFQAQTTVDLTARLDLDINFIWTRIGNPKNESDGSTPDSDDFSVTFGIGFEF
jgi:hypothetical protein